MKPRNLFILCLTLMLVKLPARIQSIQLEFIPPGVKLTGSLISVQYTVVQDQGGIPVDLTFFRQCQGSTLQTMIKLQPTSETTVGSHVVSLCDGDRIENRIYAIGVESGSSVLVPSGQLGIRSDTVPPDPPSIDPAYNNFPKTVFTPTFEIRGRVDNSNPAGNATDKPETSGTVVVFHEVPDSSKGMRRIVLGGGLIQPNSRFIATVDLSSLEVGQTVTLKMVARDSQGNDVSGIRSLGDIENCKAPDRPITKLRSSRTKLFEELYR